MGGVDLTDMMISLCKIIIKTKRWYLKLYFNCVDIAKVNAWLLCSCHCDQRNVSKKSQLSLLEFSVSFASSLANAQTVQITRPVGRPSRSSIEAETRKRTHTTVTPVTDFRYDKITHWPDFQEAKNKCKHCKTRIGRVYCKRCNLCL